MTTNCPAAPNRPAALKREERSAAIMAATSRLIARRGAASATLWRIARDSGVNERTIVSIFGSKEGILRQLCAQHMAALLAAMESADRPTEHRRCRLDAMAVAVIGTIADRAAAHATTLLSQDRLPLSERRDLRQQQRWMVALFVEALEAVVPAAVARPDLSRPAALSLLVMLNQHGLWFRDAGPMRRSTYAHFAVSAVLAALRQELRRQAPKAKRERARRLKADECRSETGDNLDAEHQTTVSTPFPAHHPSAASSKGRPT